MLKKLDFAPGVSRESTQYAESGRWYDSQNIRFRGGYPESIGGWSRDSDYELDGFVRDMYTWTDYSSSELFAVATDWRVYIIAGGVATNITPIRKTTEAIPSENFKTLHNPTDILGNVVTGEFIQVEDTGHGVGLNTFIHFSNMTGAEAAWDVGGINLQTLLENTDQQVVHVYNQNKYWINAGSAVTTAGPLAAGEDARADYEENVGLSTSTTGNGWGTGVWGGDSNTSEITGVTVGSTTTILAVNTFLDGDEVYIRGIVEVSPGGDLENALNDTLFTITTATAANFIIPVNTTGFDAWDSGGTAAVGEGWGDPSTVEVSTGTERFTFLDNYNEDLIYSNNGGAIYYWDTSENSNNGIPSAGPLGQRLEKLSDFTGSITPPELCSSMMVSDRDGHVIAFGCNDIGNEDQNNLLIRWSDQNNPFDWVPTTSNTSGGQMLRVGSTIVGSVNTKSEVLVFTDRAVYSMRFVGPPDIFSFSLVSEGVELLTERSGIDVANVVYFMGSDKFYAYTGSVSPLDCPLVKEVFSDFNKEASSKVFLFHSPVFLSIAKVTLLY